MLRVSHFTLILISGTIWFFLGFILLRLGISHLSSLTQSSPLWTPLIDLLNAFVYSSALSTFLLVAGALTTGFVKCRYVLSKSAHRGVNRLLSLPNPSNLLLIYSPKYYILIGTMMTLGYFLKSPSFPPDLRGTIDISIGTALLIGSFTYFKTLFMVRKTSP